MVAQGGGIAKVWWVAQSHHRFLPFPIPFPIPFSSVALSHLVIFISSFPSLRGSVGRSGRSPRAADAGRGEDFP